MLDWSWSLVWLTPSTTLSASRCTRASKQKLSTPDPRVHVLCRRFVFMSISSLLVCNKFGLFGWLRGVVLEVLILVIFQFWLFDDSYTVLVFVQLVYQLFMCLQCRFIDWRSRSTFLAIVFLIFCLNHQSRFLTFQIMNARSRFLVPDSEHRSPFLFPTLLCPVYASFPFPLLLLSPPFLLTTWCFFVWWRVLSHTYWSFFLRWESDTDWEWTECEVVVLVWVNSIVWNLILISQFSRLH